MSHVQEAFDTNWIAPVGPHLQAFEEAFAQRFSGEHCLALVSGTAALHLALRALEVGAGDEVLCSSLTFVASAAPILYQGARPVFVDSEVDSWNLDPVLLEQALESKCRAGRRPRAVVVTDLYGQCADYARIEPLCAHYQVPLIEDAAEALGATCKGQVAGSFGRFGIFSFNGNKIITTSGGGMLVSKDAVAIERARFLSTQARDPAPHYEHSEWGYNYRMSNVLAGIGRAQLSVLDDRVAARQAVFQRYCAALGALPGLQFMPEASWGKSTRWLTCLTIDPREAGVDREQVRLALDAQNIEARPVWKPLHAQPVFADCEAFGGTVSEGLFERGLCLPSGSSLTAEEQQRVIECVLECFRKVGSFGANRGSE